MRLSELDAWWIGHPMSVRHASAAYRPSWMDAEDFQSELYLHCRTRIAAYEPAHSVRNWVCLEARLLRARLLKRKSRECGGNGTAPLELDGLSGDDRSAVDSVSAPDGHVDELLDLSRAVGAARLSSTQMAVLEGVARGFTTAEIAGLLGLSQDRVKHVRGLARRSLAAAGA